MWTGRFARATNSSRCRPFVPLQIFFGFLSGNAFPSPLFVGGFFIPKRAVRIHEDLDGQLQKTARERGYRTPSAFIRAAIESEVRSRNEIAGIEAQTGASFDRVSQELRRVQRNQQALFALVDALTKLVITCLPEPPSEVRAQAIAGGKERYRRLLRTAGQTMATEALAAMEELLNHGKE